MAFFLLTSFYRKLHIQTGFVAISEENATFVIISGFQGNNCTKKNRESKIKWIRPMPILVVRDV